MKHNPIDPEEKGMENNGLYTRLINTVNKRSVLALVIAIGIVLSGFGYAAVEDTGNGPIGVAQAQETIELTVDANNYMYPGSNQTYKVVFVNATGGYDVTDSSSVTSNNTSAITVDETQNKLYAVDNTNISERVDVTAEYSSYSTDIEIAVGTNEVKNIPELTSLWRINAVMNDDFVFALILGMFGAVIGAFIGTAFFGLGLGTVIMIVGWFAGYVPQGMLIVVIISATFLGLNLGANIDYTVRQ